jgi:hypothetical protein
MLDPGPKLSACLQIVNPELGHPVNPELGHPVDPELGHPNDRGGDSPISLRRTRRAIVEEEVRWPIPCVVIGNR